MPPPPSPHCVHFWRREGWGGGRLGGMGLWLPLSLSLDAVLVLIVVHGLLVLREEGVHALVGAQEPVHAHDGLEGQDAVGTEEEEEEEEEEEGEKRRNTLKI